MKIGILTLYRQMNYGALLQARALLEVLREMQHEVEFVPLDCLPKDFLFSENTIELFYPWKKSSRQRWKRLLADIPATQKSRLRRAKTRSFIQKFLHEGKEHYPYGNDLSALAGYDAIVVGSDQVWNPATGNLPAYLLASIPASIRRIAYAASLGIETITSEWVPLFRENLPRFSAIGVREPSAIGILKRDVADNLDVRYCVDPTILLPPEKWYSLVPRCSSAGYAMLYWLGGMEGLEATVLRIRAAGFEQVRLFLDWRVFTLLFKPRDLRRLLAFLQKQNVSCQFDAGPLEFLQGIANAEIVISDSFHAMCLASIYEKPMRILPRSHAMRKGMSARMEDFAARYQMSAVLDNGTTPLDCPPLDYPSIRSLIELDRSASQKFLETALK